MNRYEKWILEHIVERDGARIGHLYETAPFGRDNVKKAVKALIETGQIFREGISLFPSDENRLKPTETDVPDRLKPTETDGLVPPHAPPPKNLKPGSNRAHEATTPAVARDLDPYVVVCTWRESRPSLGLCNFAHQAFFGNRNDAHAHFKAHCREMHPSQNWEVQLIERKTGESVTSWSTQPYEPVPYEVAKLGLNAFIKSKLEAKVI